MANKNGILNGVPAIIAELGPGNSLGVGLAGLISGAEKYYGLDVVEYCSSAETLGLFDEIVPNMVYVDPRVQIILPQGFNAVRTHINLAYSLQ